MKRKFFLYRRKKIDRRESQNREFDSTSIGDIAFLLLIFFIVTSSFILRQGIFFSLPSKSAGSMKINEKLMADLYPLNDGFNLNGDKLSRENVIGTLKKLKEKNKDIITIIHMSPDVKYKRLVDALSVTKESGIKKVSLKNYKKL